MDRTAALLQLALMDIVVPLWLVSGWLDYACHVKQRIEFSAGWRESLLHLIMLGELGGGVLAALWLEIDAAVLALMLVACIAHEFTVWRDLAYAETLRRIPWYEQIVHGVQQALPWVALAALGLLHADQALAMFGLGAAPADWRLRWKEEPLPAAYPWAVMIGAAVFVGVPFLLEFRRCRRVATAQPGLATIR